MDRDPGDEVNQWKCPMYNEQLVSCADIGTSPTQLACFCAKSIHSSSMKTIFLIKGGLQVTLSRSSGTSRSSDMIFGLERTVTKRDDARQVTVCFANKRAFPNDGTLLPSTKYRPTKIQMPNHAQYLGSCWPGHCYLCRCSCYLTAACLQVE